MSEYSTSEYPTLEALMQGNGGSGDEAGSERDPASFCPRCGQWRAGGDPGHVLVDLPRRLWIYTNYDCNLECRYCLVSSSPRAERRGIALDTVRRLLDEARDLGVEDVFFTGGEPFILPDIYAMIRAATPHFITTVLSNALLLQGRRLELLREVNHPNLRIQVSLDDSEPGRHDAQRGAGTWRRTVDRIRGLQAAGLRVRIGTTVTPEGLARLATVRAFVRDDLGIPDEDHVVRPLTRRGVATEGLELSRPELAPELTVDRDGVYWHPVGTQADLFVTREILPLRSAFEQLADSVVALGPVGARLFR